MHERVKYCNIRDLFGLKYMSGFGTTPLYSKTEVSSQSVVAIRLIYIIPFLMLIGKIGCFFLPLV